MQKSCCGLILQKLSKIEDDIPKIWKSTEKRAGNSIIQGATGKRLPPNAGKGQNKGSPNKVTKTLKEALLASFETLGGEAWLVQLAESDPKAYASLLGRLVPSEIGLEVERNDERIIITQGHFIVRDSWLEIESVIVAPPLPDDNT